MKVICNEIDETCALRCKHRKPHNPYIDENDDCTKEVICGSDGQLVKCVEVEEDKDEIQHNTHQRDTLIA
jgi:hypothetical protein